MIFAILTFHGFQVPQAAQSPPKDPIWEHFGAIWEVSWSLFGGGLGGHLEASPLQEAWQTHLQGPPPARALPGFPEGNSKRRTSLKL